MSVVKFQYAKIRTFCQYQNSTLTKITCTNNKGCPNACESPLSNRLSIRKLLSILHW